ncbi:Protein TILLER ANGLE CONTROL 1 [Heracleum sosnowskyi]|uniref:Protein TILLER ANGLE CONTROL 1 n=1 Tax=Heracleum sosnowskyi TaxID=360622 RepID=A0AAD8HZE1_9APIA|nr:Protein TILLER ANGLE CONTROL 1 [Heracleum sosnowskyi]
MKIFNWVHCKFHNKDGWSNGQVKKKAESDTIDDQHVALADAIASWRHGILAIGTLGFDPLKHFNQLNEIQLLCNEQDEKENNSDGYEHYSSGEKCIEESNGDQDPLIQHAAKPGFNSSSRHDNNELPYSNVHDQEPNIMHTSVDHVDTNNSNNYNLGINKREIEGERVTLADLFLVDCEEFIGVKPRTHDDKAAVVMIQTEENDYHMIKKAEEATISPPAKMAVPRPKEDSHSSRPIKKINRLMTKILKRKIHPEGKMNGFYFFKLKIYCLRLISG